MADPSVEPTDDDLRELSREAFADVAGANQAALRALREQIAQHAEAVLEGLARRAGNRGTTA
jgi:hypothetical protein